jgi:hypothetical protein
MTATINVGTNAAPAWRLLPVMSSTAAPMQEAMAIEPNHDGPDGVAAGEGVAGRRSAGPGSTRTATGA